MVIIQYCSTTIVRSVVYTEPDFYLNQFYLDRIPICILSLFEHGLNSTTKKEVV